MCLKQSFTQHGTNKHMNNHKTNMKQKTFNIETFHSKLCLAHMWVCLKMRGAMGGWQILCFGPFKNNFCPPPQFLDSPMYMSHVHVSNPAHSNIFCGLYICTYQMDLFQALCQKNPNTLHECANSCFVNYVYPLFLYSYGLLVCVGWKHFKWNKITCANVVFSLNKQIQQQ